MGVREIFKNFGVLDWRSMPVELEFRSLPATVTQSAGFKSNYQYFIYGIGGLTMFVWLGSSFLPQLWKDPGAALDDWIVVLIVCSFLLLMAFATVLFISVGVINVAKRRRVRFDEGGVHVKERGLFRETEWSIPYSDFEGVLYRSAQAMILANIVNFQVIELHHRNPRMSVSLYVRKSGELLRQRWKQYVRQFKLPAIQESDDGIIVQSPDELDETFPKRVRKIENVSVVQENPPPKEITIGQGHIMGDAADILQLRPRKPLRWPLGVTVVSLIYLAWFLAWGGVRGWSDKTVAIIIFAGAMWWLYDWYRNPVEIFVSRTRVSFGRVDAGDPLFPLKDIEDVLIRPVEGCSDREAVVAISRNSAVEEIIFSTGEGSANSVCNNLSEEALNWLRDYILAAVARARG